MIGHSSYEKYGASAIPWLDKIPSHWKVSPFLALAHECRTKNCGLTEKNLLSLSYGRIIKKDINSGFGLLPESFETYQIIEKDDLVFRFTDLQNDQRSLRSALTPERGIITSAYIAVRPTKVSPSFANYLMRAYDLQKVFYAMGGGLRQSLKYEDLRRLPLALPPEDEQKEICTFLDRETSRIDALIQKRTRFTELLNEKLLATTALTAQDTSLPKIRLAHLVNVVSRPVNQELGASYKKLGLLNRGRGIFIKDETETEDMGDSDFFWVKNGDLIVSGQFAWEGAVAIADKRHTGCVVSHRFPILRGKEGVALTEYIFSLLLTDFGSFILNDCSRGSAGRNRPLNLEDLLKWKIPLPSLEQQRKIANLYLIREQMTNLIAKQVRLLEEHRSALIVAVATGKIDVRKSK
jgi:type I restriction enzyme S subunit